MAIQQINPIKAKEILDQDPGAIYVDVRSIPEFVQGHPIRAVNIPLLHLDEETEQMVPNPDFFKVAEKVLPKDKKLVVGCKSGGRSQKACEIMERMGFQNLHNVLGSFGGGMNPMTGQFEKGWKDLGLPVSTENGEGVSYESLSAKTNK